MRYMTCHSYDVQQTCNMLTASKAPDIFILNETFHADAGPWLYQIDFEHTWHLL
jgi:hypothetical protein